MMTSFSSYGSVEQSLGHIERVVLDTGEFIRAHELRIYATRLRQEAEEQAKLLQQFADAARAFAYADELAQGVGRPQYDQARDKLDAAHQAWRAYQQRTTRSSNTGMRGVL